MPKYFYFIWVILLLLLIGLFGLIRKANGFFSMLVYMVLFGLLLLFFVGGTFTILVHLGIVAG